MHERADLLPGTLVTRDADWAHELEERLVESSTLAFRVAFSVLRHQQDAEDVAQEALAKACRSFVSLRDRGRFRAWLVRATWRLALDRLRAERRRRAREAETLLADARRTQDAPDERLATLWAAIDALPEKLRIAIVLASIEGYDVREVAALLRIPTGTVKSRLFLARQHLKDALKP